MNVGYFEKSICELSREPNKTLVMLKVIEQQRFTDGKETEAEKHRWISGVPEKKYAHFLLKIRFVGSKYERIIKAFYAEKWQINAEDPSGDYDSKLFDVWGEHDEYYLVEGYYEDAQWYNDKSCYCKINEKDIIAWQPLPEA
jgi:hypothetical protein